MFWILLYLYVIGVINDIMFAISCEADFSDWRVHASIAIWPISVPYCICSVAIESILNRE